MNNIEFRLLRVPFGPNDIELMARLDGRIMMPVAFETVPDGEMRPPAIGLSASSAQNLIDELWTCGMRPTEGSGSSGSLLATQNHLDDMKKIAFHSLKIKG